MDLDLTDSEVAFQAEARDWLAANVPASPLPSMDTPEGFVAHQEWEKKLFDAGWAVVSWPREFGGREASLVEWVIFEEEYYRAGAPGRVSQNGIFLLAPIVFDHATPEQQQRYLPTMASGEQVWAQAWSEPEAGSDLASLKSSASRVEGGWRLNGQKTWSSRAALAHWGFGLFRSDPEAARHAGLTYFCFPLDSEGITVRPIAQLDGEAGFAEIFFDDVFVADADVLGAPGDGWRVAMSTAGNERGLSLRSPGRFCAAADRLVDLFASAGTGVESARTSAADAVVDAWIKAQAYRLYTWGTVTRLAAGGDMGTAGSVNKVFWSELDVALHETALDLLGPEAEVESPWTDGYVFSLSGPIYAGTNEIQRNIVAERILGLPKEPRTMRFTHTEEQSDFARTLEKLLAGADTVATARAWADGDTAPGLTLWHTLAEQGVHALLVPEASDGMGATPVELVIAMEAIGRHAVPGPYVEAAAFLPHILAGEQLGEIAAGRVATVAVPPHTPYALDADVAETIYLVDGESLSTAGVGEVRTSIDPTRRLAVLSAAETVGDLERARLSSAFDLAALATAAQLLGAGERILADSVTYVKQRKQFGREIGSYQAIKHQLADVRIALDFVRPLVDGAAVAPTSRDCSAAKVAAADAAYRASRVGLQVHGAIGYTAEFDLSLWLLKVRALVGAWGTPAVHRARVLESLVAR